MVRLYEEGMALNTSNSPMSQKRRMCFTAFLHAGLAAYTDAQRAEARMEALRDVLAQMEARNLEEEEEEGEGEEEIKVNEGGGEQEEGEGEE
jgi:hypothetical protein